MACSDYGVTDGGFIIPSIDEVLGDIQLSMIGVLPQLTFGDKKAETAIATSMAQFVQCLYQDVFDVYSAQNPIYSSGCRLDILAARSGIYRLEDETDAELRVRLREYTTGSGRLSGDACFDDVFVQLQQLSGVTEIQVNVNDSSMQQGVLAPNSYELIVLGGDAEEIGEVIWANHPPGITISGNTNVQISDCSGLCRNVSFTRPRLVPIFIDIRVERTSVTCGCPSDDTSVIVEAISELIDFDGGACFSRIGQSISVQDFYAAVYSIQGIGVTCGLISRDGNCADNSMVSLKRDEVPFFSLDCINVEFTDTINAPCTTNIYKCPPEECTFTLELNKESDKTEFNNVGEIVTYTYTITNTGVAPLTEPISIVDDKATVTCSSLPVGGLLVGDSLTCTSLYSTAYIDAIEGGVTNTAQAISGNFFSDIATATVDYTGDAIVAEMTLTKTLVSGSCTSVGNTLEYQYVITNTGNIPITEQPIVSDDKIPGIICPPLPAGGLLPTQSITATANTIVTQDMINDGEICNTARASAGTDLGSLISNSVELCINCSNGGIDADPVPPADIVVTDCANAFPINIGMWSDDAGNVTLSANGTDTALGVTLVNTGVNTAEIQYSGGTLTNGTVTVTGTDTGSNTATQDIVINCTASTFPTAFVSGQCGTDGAFPEPKTYCGTGVIPNSSPSVFIGGGATGHLCGSSITRIMVGDNNNLYLDFSSPLSTSVTQITIGGVVIPIVGGSSNYIVNNVTSASYLQGIMSSSFSITADC